MLAACDDAGRPGPADTPPVGSTSRLAGLLGSADQGFPMVTEPREFRFPADHGPHPRFRNEWWYVTGNLDSVDGERFGYELTVFRFALSPEPVPGESSWRNNQVYVGHLAISDAKRESFHVAQRFARGALGLAGATARPFRVWLEDWEMRGSNGGRHGMPWRLAAADREVSLSLTLDAEKEPVMHGDNGLSQKSSVPGNASYYYSMTRLRTAGSLVIGDTRYEVSGQSWLDREWSSSALSPGQAGWDWFALQFDDGTELMYYQLRRTDGSLDSRSSGTFVGADEEAVHLAAGDVDIRVLDSWESPLGGRYPSRWAVRSPAVGIDVIVTPIFSAQELDATVRYWEGAVDIVGARESGLSGRGYVELTGYAGE